MSVPFRFARPAVLDRIPAPFAVLEASAGTGKTYTLEHLVADRVLAGIPLERILVVTFTEKAALELRSRIRALWNRLLSEEAPEAPEDAPCWILDGAAGERVKAARAAMERATVATIHGFCQRVLQESALERRSLFDQTQADARQLFDCAWRDLLRGEQEAELRSLLARALGAGWSVEALGHLLWEVHRERAELVPGPDALSRFRRSFPAATPEVRDEIRAAWAAAKVRKDVAERAGTALDAVAALLAAPLEPWEFVREWDALKLTSLRSAMAKAVGEGPAAQLAAWLAEAPPTEESVLANAFLEPVRARLEAIKAAEGLFDFDDMILRVRDALAGPGGEALADRLRERFQVALIDECQDTDAAQWEIFRTLFHREGHELVLVGDPKQAIYGFRGGDLPTYLGARELLAPRGSAVELGENFRSTAPLLAACERIFAHEGFFTGPVGFRPVACGRPDLGLEDAQGASLPPLRVIRVETLDGGTRLWRRVAAGLARELRDLLASGACFGPGGNRQPLSNRHVFVLVGNASEGRLMAEALGAAGLPFAFFKQRGLFGGPEALAWLHLLRAVEAPRDRGRLARALLTPFFGASVADLDALRDLREDHPALQRLRAWGETARRRRFADLVEQVLRESAVAERVLLRNDERTLVNLRHLGELLVRAAAERHGDLALLIRQLSRWRKGLDFPPGENGDEQRLEGRSDAVQILTLHAAKGLEAPVVAVFAPKAGRASALHRFHGPDGARRLHLGRSPEGSDAEARIEAEEAQEQERLMYVALTRAQAQLVVPCFVVDGAKGSGPVHPKGPLRVLNRVLRPLLEAGEDPAFSVVPLAEPQGDAFAEAEERPAAEPASALHPPRLDPEALRAAARPRRATSFTALQRRLEEVRAPEPEDPEPDAPDAAPDGLPRGRTVGTLLHELLEALDPAALPGDFDGWWGDPGVRESVLRRAALAGLGPDAAREAARRAFLGFTTPLPLHEGAAPLAAADRLLRELDFLTGLPGSADFLGGSLDALFEKDGLAYVLDWKSNGLADYGSAALEACVAEHYALQVRIYTLAALRFLDIRDEATYEARFGGVRYVFLRGLPAAGVWTCRPTWTEVGTWERDLAATAAEAFRG
ncbi:UvrD-helicase domain-containing protein [Geothrix sp. 21YS21S-4]|uniref:UvrD-helicase domain-containing protein n=1 Tax=Geothrix sp. 21YS21S-4 TaxID=3068889 RepID=UPI0027B93D83|nr:UvrD-helicase domain-containing protein [Geothrix sp. 21YS21S-4]